MYDINNRKPRHMVGKPHESRIPFKVLGFEVFYFLKKGVPFATFWQ
jgi:hypothetical protein